MTTPVLLRDVLPPDPDGKLGIKRLNGGGITIRRKWLRYALDWAIDHNWQCPDVEAIMATPMHRKVVLVERVVDEFAGLFRGLIATLEANQTIPYHQLLTSENLARLVCEQRAERGTFRATGDMWVFAYSGARVMATRGTYVLAYAGSIVASTFKCNVIAYPGSKVYGNMEVAMMGGEYLTKGESQTPDEFIRQILSTPVAEDDVQQKVQ